MILDLTIENLQKAGYTEEEINRLYNAKNDCTLDTLYESKNIFVSKTENKFYTGIDFWRVICFKNSNKIRFPFFCTELFNEYFELTLNKFLEKQKAELSIYFDLKVQTEKFIFGEIRRNENVILEDKERHKLNRTIGSEWQNTILKNYIQFLDNKLFINNQSQQPEGGKSDEVKNPPQHSQIFKGNNFEKWQRMFDEFKITKRSRTDIDFMFQIMKYDNLIYDNIGLTDIQNWISETYQMAVEKVKYTDPNSTPNEKRMSTYNLINSK